MAARELLNLHLKGLQMHIGSQLTQAKPFLEAVRKVAPLAASLKKNTALNFLHRRRHWHRLSGHAGFRRSGMVE
ncbi:MAG: hypothetical protein ACLT38_10665 [Akkermansia sp.]